MTINPKQTKIDVSKIVNENQALISYSSKNAGVEDLNTTIWFDNEIQKIYSYVQGHLVEEQYQIEVLRDMINDCNDVIVPDVSPDLELGVKHITFNTYKGKVPNTSAKITLHPPEPKGSMGKALAEQSLRLRNQQINFLSSIFTTQVEITSYTDRVENGYDQSKYEMKTAALSSYLFTEMKPTAAGTGDEIYSVQPDVETKLLLNTLNIMNSMYEEKPQIVQSDYVLNKLNELIAFLANVKIFRHNIFFKRTMYSGKIKMRSFLNTYAMSRTGKYIESKGGMRYSIGAAQYIRFNLLLTPYVKYYNEKQSGIKNIKIEKDEYTLKEIGKPDIELLESVKLIYTTDTISDVPTFDFSSQNGSNGRFTFYKTIDTEDSELVDKIDLTMFNIAKGKQIYAQDVMSAIQFIIRMWIENIKTYYYTLYICHANCHSNDVLDMTNTGRAITLIYLQCENWYNYYNHIVSVMLDAVQADGNGKATATVVVDPPDDSSHEYPPIGTLIQNIQIDALEKHGLYGFFKCNRIQLSRRFAYPILSLYDRKLCDQYVISVTDKAKKKSRLRAYQRVPVTVFNDGRASNIYKVDDKFTIQAPSSSQNLNGKARADFYGGMSESDFTNTVTSLITPWCLDSTDTLFINVKVEAKKYKYMIHYVNSSTNREVCSPVTRTFTILDNNTHLAWYNWHTYFDGLGRPAMCITVSDINSGCNFNINKIDIDGISVVTYNDRTRQLEVTSNSIIRQYIDESWIGLPNGPGGQKEGFKYSSVGVIHDKIRRATQYNYAGSFGISPISEHGVLNTQYYVPLLDYYSAATCFFKCAGKYKTGFTPTIPAYLDCSRDSCAPDPLTRKYAILPLHLLSLSKHDEDAVYDVRCYVS